MSPRPSSQLSAGMGFYEWEKEGTTKETEGGCGFSVDGTSYESAQSAVITASANKVVGFHHPGFRAEVQKIFWT